MKCPKCKHKKTKVLETEKYDTCVLRVRRCCKCGHVWDTDETAREYDRGAMSI
jgi:transcriptional regulator NrdR family protein